MARVAIARARKAQHANQGACKSQLLTELGCRMSNTTGLAMPNLLEFLFQARSSASRPFMDATVWCGADFA
jgi:hypothetical protein